MRQSCNIPFWSELETDHISCGVSWLLVLLIPMFMFIVIGAEGANYTIPQDLRAEVL